MQQEVPTAPYRAQLPCLTDGPTPASAENSAQYGDILQTVSSLSYSRYVQSKIQTIYRVARDLATAWSSFRLEIISQTLLEHRCHLPHPKHTFTARTAAIKPPRNIGLNSLSHLFMYPPSASADIKPVSAHHAKHTHPSRAAHVLPM